MTLIETLLERLSATVDDVVSAMAGAIRQEFPHYRKFNSEVEERAWREGLRATVMLFVDVATASRGLKGKELSPITAIGAARAEQGLPLDVVLGSVRLAMHVVLSAVRREAPADQLDLIEYEDAIDEISLRMTRFVNEVSTEISRGYFARSEERVTSLTRYRSQFGNDVLAGAFTSHEHASVTGKRMGIDLPPTVGLILVAASGSVQAAVVAQIARTVPLVLAVPMGAAPPHAVLIVRAASRCDWNVAVKAVTDTAGELNVTAILVPPCEGPQEWHMRYVQAARSLTLVGRFADGRSVLDAADLLPAQLVGSAALDTLQAIEREVLTPLREHHKAKRLLYALDALMRTDGSPKAAARLLGVAVTTARTYRDTIENATGLYFSRPQDAMRLGLGWIVLRHLEWPPRQ